MPNYPERSYSEVFAKIMNQIEGNDKVVLQAWSKLIEEDTNNFVSLIRKLSDKTGLSRKEISESLKRLRIKLIRESS
jgi:hypothetical protein